MFSKFVVPCSIQHVVVLVSSLVIKLLSTEVVALLNKVPLLKICFIVILSAIGVFHGGVADGDDRQLYLC